MCMCLLFVTFIRICFPLPILHCFLSYGLVLNVLGQRVVVFGVLKLLHYSVRATVRRSAAGMQAAAGHGYFHVHHHLARLHRHRLQLHCKASKFFIADYHFINGTVRMCVCVFFVYYQAVFCGLCCLSVVDTEEMEKEQAYADPSADGRDNEEAIMQTSGEKDKEAGYSPPPVRLHPSVNTSTGGGGGGNSTSPYGTFEEREAVKDEKTSLPAKTTGIDVDID